MTVSYVTQLFHTKPVVKGIIRGHVEQLPHVFLDLWGRPKLGIYLPEI